MTIMTVDQLKTHLNITGEQDDAVLADYIEAAEDYAFRYSGLTFAEDEEIPACFKQAVRMLAGHYYQNREATLTGERAEEVFFGVKANLDLIGNVTVG